MAICDFPSPDADVDADAPGSVRLATSLLRLMEEEGLLASFSQQQASPFGWGSTVAAPQLPLRCNQGKGRYGCTELEAGRKGAALAIRAAVAGSRPGDDVHGSPSLAATRSLHREQQQPHEGVGAIQPPPDLTPRLNPSASINCGNGDNDSHSSESSHSTMSTGSHSSCHGRPELPTPAVDDSSGQSGLSSNGDGGGGGSVGFGPYLRSLPCSPPAMLLSFAHPSDLAALEYPPLQQAVLSYRSLAAKHYRRAGGGHGGLAGASLEQFMWALAVVGSRCLATNMLFLALLAPPPPSPPSPSEEPRDAPGSGPAPIHAVARGHDRACAGGAPSSAATASAGGRAVVASAAASPLSMQLMLLTLASTKRLTAVTAGGAEDDLERCQGTGSGAYTASSGDASVATAGAVASSGLKTVLPPTPAVTADCGATRSGRPAASGDPRVGGELRMLVPLLDLMNHRGARRVGGRLDSGFSDGESCGGGERVVWEANVRWELRPPSAISQQVSTAHSAASTPTSTSTFTGASGAPLPLQPPAALGGWRVAVVTTSHVAAGQELCLCYDVEGSNDAFALHYGFVPPFNPYDDVQLYDNLAEALEWHAADALAVGQAGGAGAQLPAVHNGASMPTATAAVAAGGEAGARQAEPEPDDAAIKLHPGGRVSARLLAELRPLYGGREDLVAAAVRRRCVQLLAGRTPLLGDLQLLLAAATAPHGLAPPPLAVGDGSLAEQHGRRSERREQQAGHGHRTPPQQLPAARELAGLRSGSSRSQVDVARTAALAHGELQQRRMGAASAGSNGGGSGSQSSAAVPASEAASWAALMRHYGSALAAQPPQLQTIAGLGAASQARTPTSAQANGDLTQSTRRRDAGPCGPSQRPPQQQHDPSAATESGCQGGGAGWAAAGLAPPLTPQQRLALVYRTFKKMLLWDCVLGYGDAVAEAPAAALAAAADPVAVP